VPILASCQKVLQTWGNPVNPIGDDPGWRDGLREIGSQVLTDVATSVRARGAPVDDHHQMTACDAGQAGDGWRLRPADSLRVARLFFDVTVTSLARHVRHDPELMPGFVVGVLALNRHLTMRVEQATVGYTSDLLDHIHKAHLDERRRVARELHDRLGEGLSVALRQLDLHEIKAPGQPLQQGPRAELAREALVESMRRLREVTSDLRHDLVTSLEKALAEYLDSVAGEASVQLRMSGEETWAAPAVLDEVFLIIREAIRNALQHGAPRRVLVTVELVPYELRAWVRDDGCGFVPADRAGAARTAGAAGLATMRERAALLQGRLMLSSVPGRGTCVALSVPLPGPPDEQPG
jgi:signal transduction histidine kinase